MASICLDIITAAMREDTILGLGKEPKAAESEACLSRLQAILDDLWGAGIGSNLTDQEINSDTTLTADTRALVYASSPLTLTFPELPFNGARIQVKDMLSSFATHNVTLDGNNRLIALSSTGILNDDGDDTTWVYLADSANWAKVSDLELSDIFPLPDVEFFTLALAKRIAPMFGAQFRSEDALLRAANRLRAKFASQVVVPADDGVRYLSRQSWTHGLLGPSN